MARGCPKRGKMRNPRYTFLDFLFHIEPPFIPEPHEWSVTRCNPSSTRFMWQVDQVCTHCSVNQSRVLREIEMTDEGIERPHAWGAKP